MPSPMIETLERAAVDAKFYGRTADAARLRVLASALGHQPILWCAEEQNPITDHNRGTVRVCGWCAGCSLDALLTEAPDGDK